MSTELTGPLRSLAERMNARLEDFQQRPPPFGHAEPMLRQATELERRLNGTGAARPPRDFLREALNLVYSQGPRQALSTHLRYLCWAFMETTGRPPRRLLDATRLFPATLAELEKLRDEPIFRLMAWRGLLETYFQYSPEADDTAAAQNWRLLRDFLARELPRVARRAKFQPAWLQVIDGHMNLLGDDPCARYAPSVLAADEGDIQRLRDELRIPEESWFWSELLLSQVRTVTERKDAAFRDALPPLLEQLQQHESVRNTGLALLLDRYAQASFRNIPHKGLRDAAVGAWHSPYLYRNARWGLVNPDTKRMVQQWLTVRALTDFFRLLQEDRAADERRLKFWLRFWESIEYFHLALGPDVYESQQADYVAIRKSYRDQICRLTNPGSPGNNAFILKIGEYIFVEFGAVGNAVYGYDEKRLPFKFNNSTLNLNVELKVRRNAVLWLRHATNTHEPWEHKLERELAQLGIYPKQPRPVRPRTRSTRSSHPERSTTSTSPGNSGTQAISFAHQAGVQYEDLRDKGGALWIRHDSATGELAQQLGKLGFRYYEGRGWWRK